MTHRDFCYWLQGFFEIAGHNLVVRGTPMPVTVTPAQADLIEKHLELVFAHDAYLEEQTLTHHKGVIYVIRRAVEDSIAFQRTGNYELY